MVKKAFLFFSILLGTWFGSLLIQFPLLISLFAAKPPLWLSLVLLGVTGGVTIFILYFLHLRISEQPNQLKLEVNKLLKISLTVPCLIILEIAIRSILTLGLNVTLAESPSNSVVIEYLHSDYFPVICLATNLFAPIVEECLFRGLLEESLLLHFPKMIWLNVLVTSLLFAYVHFYTLSFDTLLMLIPSTYFSFLYLKTRDIRYTIFAHIVFNLLITFLMYISL